MKVLEKAKTPNGTAIQIEEWHKDYEFIPYASTVGAYPIATRSGSGTFAPQAGKTFRVQFEFETAEEAKEAFEQLKSGEKSLLDFADKTYHPKDLICL